LFNVVEILGLKNNVFFSRDRIDFEKMNVIYNMCDVTLTMSYAEGFGLSTLESMMTGTPIIAPKTGGLTRQVVDHKDGSENGVALPIELQTLVGSQTVPYIYEDYVSAETTARGIRKIYDLDENKKADLDSKVYKYASEEFDYQKTVDAWHESMISAIDEFKNYKSWNKITI
jgi:glycosyltransferase involved in cell wall biosynthesis